ncbi:MAG TPA: cytochrome c [Blastocatellia bacterium]|nr:cytochrome c [Blastocatellia bacterium]
MTKKLTLPLLVALCLVTLAFNNSSSANSGSKKEVTFSRDVAPIFFKNCAECHRPGEAAPMSLLSYKDARPWARSIKEKVATKQMPPWHADPHIGEFLNDRRLTQAQIDTITAWVDGGAKEGDPKDLPPAPKFADGWAIGKPDIVLQMPEEFTLDASGPDEYQYFEIPTNFKEDVYVQLAEARPGNRKIVHHIIAFVQPPPKSGNGDTAMKFSKADIEKYRAEQEKRSIFRREGFLMRMKPGIPAYDDGCSLPNGGNGETLDLKEEQRNMDLLVGFAPGMNPGVMQPGTVKRIPAGSKILLQMHYSKASGKVEKDRSMIGLVLAKTPPDKHVYTRPIANTYFLIPAGADNHKVTSCWTTKEDIHLETLMPHMHLRGKDMKFEAFYPDGHSEVLIDVPNYSFSWQTVYYLKRPIALPKGTKIVVTAHFDNSVKNKFNPDPKQDVRFGEPTYDDMMIGWISYTLDKEHLRNETAVNNGRSAGK